MRRDRGDFGSVMTKLAADTGQGGHHQPPVFLLIAATGLRRGKALAARWGHVNLSRAGRCGSPSAAGI